ncbi:hypothetical protein LEP1GSC039_2980 [Leptospira santarosai str. 2000027870]|nr:hypothetical protein LEP1GSC039_2980 [Leptospira santarosai str. 2000027870]
MTWDYKPIVEKINPIDLELISDVGTDRTGKCKGIRLSGFIKLNLNWGVLVNSRSIGRT